ncbi:MAG: DNA-binding response regulator [Candidatus Zambryskibacteria bacterium CG10_big_fil_rev_8_21_14_0_10_42_12]|uniref:DNA-binding response regulator n=1 Tax=Candidatus Zambryskibacteria bacterium CG10_big_fil_rev_8_21_14_0_10_42_12 TaxID=1975115 RepID=A0A2H0QVK8_9BACT|nr:MAG: DNA-binding response regulator [Candidatus Zambryskibacteria bacterium CG10_big_fil_rev_8_21_14_0_10_42_12]
MRIALVEDEEKLADVLSNGLEQKGYAVDVFHHGDKALKHMSVNHADYDVMLLDLMLPGADGLTICKSLRDVGSTIPILILTARDEIDTKVDLLMTGADDYIVKPFSFNELVARIAAISRRPTHMSPTKLVVGGIVLDPKTRTVKKDGKEVPLTLKEFVMLEYFMKRPNEVVNREDLLTHLWDFNFSSFSNVVDVHVKNLRKKLGDDNQDILETIRGVGYRLKA